ncbi:uncharacterized protein LOC134247460 [Saccostrea cucullata]|uniref:uncharacterized protein LOC134247460 n=1 Tax=Saccostrea cuccullata TaxID=36930 RepID=UPI002ED16529
MAVQCEVRSYETFKRETTFYQGRVLGDKRTSPPVEIVGSSNEAEAKVDGIQAKALVDTGSGVNTISETFYRENLSHRVLQSFEELQIECANGENLPYLGFIEVDFESYGIPIRSSQTSIFLIVPTTAYSQKTPILIGTNILRHLMDNCKMDYGERFLQNAALFTPWYLAFRSMIIQEKILRKTNNRLGLVRSAEKNKIIIKPNSNICIKGYIDRKSMVQHPTTSAIFEHTEKSCLPKDLDITPTCFNYSMNIKEVDIYISNVTTRMVSVQPRSVLCEIQPVQFSNSYCLPDEEHHQNIGPEHLRSVSLETLLLSKKQTDQLWRLLREYNDIFSKGDTDIGHFTDVKNQINLSDESPFKQRYRRIPLSMIDEVRTHIEQLLSAGIIRKSKSPFASNVVLVKKKDGSIRMCVDYRMLNKRTIKDSYALPRIEDILDILSGSKYFIALDMKSGYHQIEIEESHKHRTAFTEHLERLQIIFSRLRECNLKLNPKKCKLFKEQVKYVGFIVSASGISTDPEKVKKVLEWPVPTHLDEVRQIVGFAGFYRRFIKDFSKIVKPLQEVMPSQNQRKKRIKVERKGWR